jgi:hypothetical protein
MKKLTDDPVVRAWAIFTTIVMAAIAITVHQTFFKKIIESELQAKKSTRPADVAY